jgi:hypothetical protein
VRKPGRGGGGGGGGGRSFLAPHWSQDFFYFFFLYQDLINYSDYPLIRCCGLDVCLVCLMLFFVLCVMDDVFFFFFSSLFSISIHICQISFLYCSPLFFSFIWKKLQSYFFSGGELISLQRCFISCWCKTAFWIYISVKVWMVFSRKKKKKG